ncbi:MAG: FAD-dependent oxidoreductase [Eubacteriales bacterium]|nr:FAD-dependent oxidoreductase [Eubacteriales bacterium]
MGSGPAGISAAITAKVRNKNIIMFGPRSLSEKIRKAHQILNYPGLPEISGQELADGYQNHLQNMDIEVTSEQVITVYSMGSYFAIQTSSNEMYEAETVILAMGLSQAKPLEKEEELLGRGVSYCATCDAQFYRGKKVIVAGFHKEAEEEAQYLAEIAEEVLYFPVYKEEVDLPGHIQVIRETPVSIFGGFKANGITTKEGNSYEADGIFILRESVSPKNLVPGLKMDGNHVEVNLQMETNLQGCFACGDLVGKPYQYIKAAGQGNVAALSAVSYLAKKKTEEKKEEK